MLPTKADIRKRWKSIVGGGPRHFLEPPDHAFVAEYAVKHPKLLGAVTTASLKRIYVGAGAPPYETSPSMHVVACISGRDTDYTLGVDPILAGLGKQATDALADYAFDKNTDQARILVEGQKREHRAMCATPQGRVVCNSCKVAFEPFEIEMDHVVQFDELITKFRANEQGRTTNFHDPKTAEKWTAFHRERARWQPLCRPCHYRKSGHETSIRAAKKRPPDVPVTPRAKRSGAPAWSPEELAALQACHDTHGHQSGKNIQHFLKALPNRSASQIYGKGVGCACKKTVV